MTGSRRVDVEFTSGGTGCAAWLYLPEAVERPPVVVMAHGFGAIRSFLLPQYAERFAAAGLAAFVFDYRHFGDSGGTPRQLVSPARQLADWRAALAHVRLRSEVNGGRVALWGTSFSGGHVLVTAAEDGGVRAAVMQVPFLDARTTPRPAAAALLRTLRVAIADVLRGFAGRPPRTMPIVGDPGETAAMTFPGWKDAYLSIVSPETVAAGLWENAMPARSVFPIMQYRPIRQAPSVKCPALLVAARHDEALPVATAEAAVKQMPNAALELLDCRHFDVYAGELFERAVTLQTRFLVEHLGG